MGNLVQKNVTSDKFTVTTSDYFDIYTLYPEVLREPIPTPGKYENLSEGIPPAQDTTHDSFSELEDIATLQESASVPNNNCTPPLELISDPFEEPANIVPIQDTASEEIAPRVLKILLVLKLEK